MNFNLTFPDGFSEYQNISFFHRDVVISEADLRMPTVFWCSREYKHEARETYYEDLITSLMKITQISLKKILLER